MNTRMIKKEIIIKTHEEMVALGYKIGLNAFPNMVITMEGDLGAGKTTMTKGIGKALGVTRIINSPTFTIMKTYEGSLELYHMDVYRINNDSGDEYLEEYFDLGGVCVIEWANNINKMLPEDRLDIKIAINSDTTRLVTLESNSQEYINVINQIDK